MLVSNLITTVKLGSISKIWFLQHSSAVLKSQSQHKALRQSPQGPRIPAHLLMLKSDSLFLSSNGQSSCTMDNKKIPKQLVNGNSNKVLKLYNCQPQRSDNRHSTKTYSDRKERKGDEVLKANRATSCSSIHQPGLHGLTRRMHMFFKCPG